MVPATASRRVKLDMVINQHDTTEITMMPRSELDHCYAVFNKKFGDGDVNSEPVVPRPDEEATAEQLSSLKAVVESGEPPYAGSPRRVLNRRRRRSCPQARLALGAAWRAFRR